MVHKRNRNFYEDFKIYKSPMISKACGMLRIAQVPSTEQIMREIAADDAMKPDFKEYRALLAEIQICRMFEALGKSPGWEVSYPITSVYVTNKGRICPGDYGKRLDIHYPKMDHKPFEIDGLVYVKHQGESTNVIIEAKSGNNGFKIRDFEKQVMAFFGVTGIIPSYVLAVPKGHEYYSNYHGRKKKRIFKALGGIMFKFQERSGDFQRIAQEMYEEKTRVIA